MDKIKPEENYQDLVIRAGKKNIASCYDWAYGLMKATCFLSRKMYRFLTIKKKWWTILSKRFCTILNTEIIRQRVLK